MSGTSWVEICVSDFAQSIAWFERMLGFRVVAREADEYAKLSLGETSIQLASDDAAYWASERLCLLQPRQRGSGVEIVLLVENIDAIYQQAQQAQADIVREIADYPWHLRQFWVRHPDGYLIRPAQKILSVNPTLYQRQIDDAFRSNALPITARLVNVKEVADTLVRQHDYLEAATVYEMLITEIFEESHIYVDDDAEYDDYSEESYYPEEEGLEAFVEACIELLGDCLADERADRVAREKTIGVLFDIYQHDLYADNSLGFKTSTSNQIVNHATPLERDTIAVRIQNLLSSKGEILADYQCRAYGKFLLDLGKETLSDEAYLQICRETELISERIDRLLTLKRIEEAEWMAQSRDNSSLLELADLFMKHQQDGVAERLVRARITEKSDVQLLIWLQHYYHTKRNRDAELEMTILLFRTRQSLTYYKELRTLAKKLDCWEHLRSESLAFLEQAHNTSLLIQIALDEGDIDTGLTLLKTMTTKDSYGSIATSGFAYYGTSLDLEVAKAAEETRPHEAIRLYQQRAERLIGLRSRNNYQAASTYLLKMHSLYERLGEQETWVKYIAMLREQNRNLRALKEELAKAGL